MLDVTGWPEGMRVIVRAERPHPGAQLRFTDLDGNRLTAFATNTLGGQHADPELRHRRRARCEDRIRNAKDTALRNLVSTVSIRGKFLLCEPRSSGYGGREGAWLGSEMPEWLTAWSSRRRYRRSVSPRRRFGGNGAQAASDI